MEWIQHIVTGMLIMALLMYANKKATKEVQKDSDGKYRLRLNGLYKWIGFLSVFIAFAVLIASIVFYEEGIFIWVALIVLLFGGLGIPLMMYHYNHELIFDEESITVTSWKGKTNSIKWEEIEQIKFSSVWGEIKIKSKTEKLSIHQHVVGLIEFVKLMEDKTEYTSEGLRLPFRAK